MEKISTSRSSKDWKQTGSNTLWMPFINLSDDEFNRIRPLSIDKGIDELKKYEISENVRENFEFMIRNGQGIAVQIRNRNKVDRIGLVYVVFEGNRYITRESFTKVFKCFGRLFNITGKKSPDGSYKKLDDMVTEQLENHWKHLGNYPSVSERPM